MLDYYLHDGPTVFCFQLMGIVNQEGARRLEQVWRTSSSLIGDRRPIIDITSVTSVDAEGRALLLGWHHAGAQFVASSKASHALAESIFGAAFLPPPANGRSWFPFRIAYLKSAVSLPVLLAVLLFTCAANAATPKPETVAAWEITWKPSRRIFSSESGPAAIFLGPLKTRIAPPRSAPERSRWLPHLG